MGRAHDGHEFQPRAVTGARVCTDALREEGRQPEVGPVGGPGGCPPQYVPTSGAVQITRQERPPVLVDLQAFAGPCVNDIPTEGRSRHEVPHRCQRQWLITIPSQGITFRRYVGKCTLTGGATITKVVSQDPKEGLADAAPDQRRARANASVIIHS